MPLDPLLPYRPDQLDTRTLVSTDWVVITPTGGPSYKCAASSFGGGGGGSGTYTVNNQTGTTYTFVLTDAGNLVTFNNASLTTATIPPNSSVAFPVGTKIDVIQLGAGRVNFAPGSGVILHYTPGQLTRTQYSGGSLIQVAANTWNLVGDVSP